MKKRIAYAIGRYSPPHKGHINTFLWLLTLYDELIIGIGSCYEVGWERHPLLAFFREKMIHWSLAVAGVDMSRVTFVHLQDFENDWDGQWKHITSIRRIDDVKALVTGNVEQIISEIEVRGIKPGFKIINPETEMPEKYEIRYHATDLRNAIRESDYGFFYKLAACGTINLMGQVGGFAGMRKALDNNGDKFVPGRQAVDIVLTCNDENDCNKKMILSGLRQKAKKNFPGYLALPGGAIDEYENAMDAAVRELVEETGIRVEIVNRYLEPAHVIVHGKQPIIATLNFVKLFSADDQKLAGDQGGSSQLFCIHLDCTKENFVDIIQTNSDLEKIIFRSVKYLMSKPMAYEQKDMLKEALKFIQIINGERNEKNIGCRNCVSIR